MPQETYTLTLSMHSLQTIAAVSTILFLTLITRAVLGVVGEKHPDLWPEVTRKTWAKWTVSIIGPLFFFALFAAFAVVYDTILNVFFPPASGSSSPNLGAGALIAALLGAPFVIWGTYIKYQSLGFQREGHITDRISKAVEQLGAEKTLKRADENGQGVEETVPNIEVRIGGLLSIERIAQDSVKYDKGRDHVRMMEILCAYICNNAPASGAVPMPFEEPAERSEDPSSEEVATYIGEIKERSKQIAAWVDTLSKPREDIQLAISIIGRRDADQRHCEARWGRNTAPDAKWVFIPAFSPRPADDTHDEASWKIFRAELASWIKQIIVYEGYRPDLRDTNLQRADLSGLILAGAKLDRAQLQGANLRQTQLQGADLIEARLEGARLESALMHGTDLTDSRAEAAWLSHTQMQGADMTRARLQAANLIFADLTDADLTKAQLQGARLSGVNLRGTKLWHAQLQWTNLSHAVLRDAEFLYAALRGASLASLRIPQDTLRQDQLDETFGDGSVHLPENHSWPKHWPQDILPRGAFDIERDKWCDSLET